MYTMCYNHIHLYYHLLKFILLTMVSFLTFILLHPLLSTMSLIRVTFINMGRDYLLDYEQIAGGYTTEENYSRSSGNPPIVFNGGA